MAVYNFPVSLTTGSGIVTTVDPATALTSKDSIYSEVPGGVKIGDQAVWPLTYLDTDDNTEKSFEPELDLYGNYTGRITSMEGSGNGTLSVEYWSSGAWLTPLQITFKVNEGTIYDPVVINLYVQPDGTLSGKDLGTLSVPFGFSSSNTGARSTELSWFYTNDDHTGFELEQNTDGVNWVSLGISGKNSRSRHISGLNPETQYSFRIRTLDSDNSRVSEWSTVIQVTTDVAPPVPTEFVQLQHFAESEYPLDIYYPRPDEETQTWARHRKNHPDVPYRVPVICAFGAPPWFFELVEGPDGMTIGSFLPQLPNGKYDWENPGDYGIVKWDNPTSVDMPVDGWTVTVRATDQELTVKTITWKLIVTTDGIIFVDSVNGDNSNSGTIDSPLLNTRGFFKDDVYDVTYSGYQVVYRNGEHDVFWVPGGLNDGGGNWYGKAKPLVHIGFPGEDVRWNYATSRVILDARVGSSDPIETKIGGSDLFIGNIRFQNFGQQEDSNVGPGSNRAFYQHGNWCTDEVGYGPDANGCRMTFFDIEVDGLNEEHYTGDNAGFTFGHRPNQNTSGKPIAPMFRRYHCFSRVKLTNSNNTGDSGANWAFNYAGACEKISMEFCFSENSNLNFPYANKAGSSDASITYVKTLDAVRPVRQMFGVGYRQGNKVGNELWRYVKLSGHGNLPSAGGLFSINDGNVDPNDNLASEVGPVSLSRATLYTQDKNQNAMSARPWEVYVRNCILSCDRADPMFYNGQPTNYPDDPDWARTFRYGTVTVPLDNNLDLTEDGSSMRGEFGAEIFGEII